MGVCHTTHTIHSLRWGNHCCCLGDRKKGSWQICYVLGLIVPLFGNVLSLLISLLPTSVKSPGAGVGSGRAVGLGQVFRECPPNRPCFLLPRVPPGFPPYGVGLWDGQAIRVHAAWQLYHMALSYKYNLYTYILFRNNFSLICYLFQPDSQTMCVLSIKGCGLINVKLRLN